MSSHKRPHTETIDTDHLHELVKDEIFNICHEHGTKKKKLSPLQELNPWPPKHRAGALSTELRELMVSKAIYQVTIKRKTLISDYKNGGLRMPHLETLIKTQRIMCMKKYFDSYNSTWKVFLGNYL